MKVELNKREVKLLKERLEIELESMSNEVEFQEFIQVYTSILNKLERAGK